MHACMLTVLLNVLKVPVDTPEFRQRRPRAPQPRQAARAPVHARMLSHRPRAPLRMVQRGCGGRGARCNLRHWRQGSRNINGHRVVRLSSFLPSCIIYSALTVHCLVLIIGRASAALLVVPSRPKMVAQLMHIAPFGWVAVQGWAIIAFIIWNHDGAVPPTMQPPLAQPCEEKTQTSCKLKEKKKQSNTPGRRISPHTVSAIPKRGAILTSSATEGLGGVRAASMRRAAVRAQSAVASGYR